MRVLVAGEASGALADARNDTGVLIARAHASVGSGCDACSPSTTPRQH